MKDNDIKTCVFGGFILGAYGIYALTNPTADGTVFASVMTALGGLVGYSYAMSKQKA